MTKKLSQVAAAVVALCAMCAFPAAAGAQEEAGAGANQRLQVFFDCSGRQCTTDQTFFRTEITWVDWVRDREDADVHVIITSQTTASGGSAFQLDFLGRGVVEGVEDRMTFNSLGTDVEQEALDGLTTTLAIGLARYAAFAGYTRAIAFEILRTGERDPDARVRGSQDVEDPWNLWVFELGARGNLRGSDNNDTEYLSGNVNASRTAPKWKWNFGGAWNRQVVETLLSDSSVFSSTLVDWRFGTETVYAVAEHWSFGLTTSLASLPRENMDLRLRVTPALEYSFYPYEDATRRALTAQYSIGPVYRDYEELTIYGELEETRIEQAVQLRYAQRQPWGDGSASVRARHILDDIDKHNVVLRGDLSLKVVKGLRFNISANASWVTDQIYISADGESDAEILLNLTTRASNFNYGFNFGFSYRFGSIYNNVVNNRFR
jgi:hypothetical protein